MKSVAYLPTFGWMFLSNIPTHIVCFLWSPYLFPPDPNNFRSVWFDAPNMGIRKWFSLCLDRYIVSNEATGAAKGFLSMICVQISCSFNCKRVKYFALHVITYSSSMKLISVCNFNFIIDISWVYDFISISCNSRSYAILCFGNSGNICSIKVKLIASW